MRLFVCSLMSVLIIACMTGRIFGGTEAVVVTSPVDQCTYDEQVQDSIDNVSEQVTSTQPQQQKDKDVGVQKTEIWQKAKKGYVKGGKSFLRGTKKSAQWTWKGICKGAYYIKEGSISVAEKTGMKINKTEVETSDRIILDAERTLAASRTRRTLREDQTEATSDVQ
ncbi:MAG: hypothetical protein KKH94_09485 [Candidatus Omnitrophica bacterium]|nr:hypothetical protein [Candidatus Omnitrophota bacterium]